eukprot:TRINITY_DN2527_c1_g1_i3.p1 TRINITY_DN2527_c1_g1~~TRINITY_DN2527_c1_g1_i3.p1  ORF type:complete len:101 (+),score=5.70 TRINITY_DN2527_c1_g1_i3:83-385(+)
MDKRILYVGGLSAEVNRDIIDTAFRTFGEILNIRLPLADNSASHKGFAFVEMESPEDAASAVENMNGGELFGRVLKVCIIAFAYYKIRKKRGKKQTGKCR